MTAARVAGAVVVLVLVGAYAALAVRWTASDPGWYAGLPRPPWQPPDIVFGIIWPLNFVALVVAGLAVVQRAPLRDLWLWLALLAASVALAVGWAHEFYVPHHLGRAAILLAGAAVLTWLLVAANRRPGVVGRVGPRALRPLAHRRHDPRSGLLAARAGRGRDRLVNFLAAGASTRRGVAEVRVRSQRRDHTPPERTLSMNLRRLGVTAAVLGLAAATVAPAASASASTTTSPSATAASPRSSPRTATSSTATGTTTTS